MISKKKKKKKTKKRKKKFFLFKNWVKKKIGLENNCKKKIFFKKKIKF